MGLSCCTTVGISEEELMRIAITILVFSCLTFNANAESVFVKYRGAVDLATFQCNWISRSSLVNRLCYDEKETYVTEYSLHG